MTERIGYLEDSIRENKELVENLRKRIEQMSYAGPDISTGDKSKIGNEITPSTVVDFLQKD